MKNTVNESIKFEAKTLLEELNKEKQFEINDELIEITSKVINRKKMDSKVRENKLDETIQELSNKIEKLSELVLRLQGNNEN